MDKKEFAIFASALRTYYPRENILPNEQAMQLWYEELKDLTYPVASAVLKKWVALNKWSPAISDIREQAGIIQSGEPKNWAEAWDNVLRLIAKYGSYREADALTELDELTRRTVKSLGFKNLCFSENITADRANFRMAYEQQAQRRRQDAQIPLALQEIIKKIGGEENEKKILMDSRNG